MSIHIKNLLQEKNFPLGVLLNVVWLCCPGKKIEIHRSFLFLVNIAEQQGGIIIEAIFVLITSDSVFGCKLIKRINP